MVKRIMLRGQVVLFVITLMFSMGSLAASNAHFDKAEKYLAEDKPKSAIIELKNLLQREPSHADARVMLGNIYFKTGDLLSAEKEFRRAAKLNSARNTWLKEYGQVLLLQKKYKDVLKLIELDASDSSELKAELLVIKGLAYQGLDRLEEAGKTYAESHALNSENGSLFIAMAQLAAKQKKYEKAVSLVNQLLEKEPENIRALMVRGDLARQEKKFDQAEDDFTQVIAIQSSYIQAHLARATIRLAKRKFDGASEDLKIVEKKYRNNPAVQYLRALLLFENKNYDKATGLLQLILGKNPNHTQSQWLYGMTSYATNNFEIAAKYLSGVVVAMPGNTQAIKLLAATRMKLKQPKAAVELLEPIIAKHANDPQVMALLGSAYVHSGEQEKGTEMLNKAIIIKPDLAVLRTELAMSLLAQGETEEAITELKSAVNLGQGVVQADILLVLSHLQKKEYEKALEASEALEDKMPESPIPFNLTGLAYLYKKDTVLASKNFNKALAINPYFFTAEMNLVRIDAANGDTEAMEQRYRSILEKSEKHLGALLGMAGLAAQEAKHDAAEEWLDKAYQLNPESPRPGIALARYYLGSKKPRKALQLATIMLAQKFPGNSDVLKTVADAQMAAGEANSAIQSYKALIGQEAADPKLWLILARAQLSAEQENNARISLKRAVALDDSFVQARVMLAGIELKVKNYDEVSRLAGVIIKKHPKLSTGYEISASALRNKQQLTKAVEMYAKGYKIQPSGRLATVLARQYDAIGKPDKAVFVLNNWLEKEPEDVAVLSMLGIQYQTMQQDLKAIDTYSKVYKLAPENLLILNNLAWLYQTKGDGKAVILSRKAYELAPEIPEIVDTYGWILFQSGEQDKGLQILQQAFVSAPTNPEIAYHVAYALHEVGRQSEAKIILKKILQEHPASSIINDVKQLLNQ